MFRRLFGRLIEWALCYEHQIEFVGDYFDGGFKGLDIFSTPYRKYNDDAGYDLCAAEMVTIGPGETKDVPSGIRISSKSMLWFEIKSRSSTFSRRNLYVQDAVIDRGWRGDLKCIVHNPNSEPAVIQIGERLCQIVPHRLIPCTFVKVDRLPESDRGEKGFGSTG